MTTKEPWNGLLFTLIVVGPNAMKACQGMMQSSCLLSLSDFQNQAPELVKSVSPSFLIRQKDGVCDLRPSGKPPSTKILTATSMTRSTSGINMKKQQETERKVKKDKRGSFQGQSKSEPKKAMAPEARRTPRCGEMC